VSTSELPPIHPEGVFDGLKWGCIIRGALLDVALTAVAFVPLILVLTGAAAFSENEEVATKVVDQALTSPEGLLLGALIGLSATVAGAYYGARRAEVHHVRHGGWVAIASLLLSLPLLFAPDVQSSIPNPLWYDVVTIAGMLPAGLLGGGIARARASAV
jgi:hypothetical protein